MSRATLPHIHRLSLERASSSLAVAALAASTNIQYVVVVASECGKLPPHGGRTLWNRVRSKMKEEEKSEGARRCQIVQVVPP